MLRISYLLLHILFPFVVAGQSLTVVELNCENLFDYRHDEGKNDEEYLPESTRHWTRQRYWRKQNHIAQTLLSCSSDGIPDLIFLCEVENDSVLNDLTHRSLLRHAGYEYLMTSSPDLRGIDVALVYSPFSFCPIRYESLRVAPVEGMRPTRDILYVAGRTVKDDTLHIYVVHFPSRFGGERYSRPFRKAAADVLCESIDSLKSNSPEAKILVAGDFNDGTDSPVFQQILRHGLCDLTAKAAKPDDVHGSYRYQGQWETIDHILGSPSIYNYMERAFIHAPRFLLEEEKVYGGYKPRRTYNGMRYQPGYSDHLPLVICLNFEKSSKQSVNLPL